MAIPSGNHTDWLWPFSLIPRRWTAVEGPAPTNVKYSPNFDKQHYNPDIPNRGASALTICKYGFSYAKTTKDGVLIAFGTCRYDYVDHYFEIGRFTIKRQVK